MKWKIATLSLMVLAGLLLVIELFGKPFFAKEPSNVRHISHVVYYDLTVLKKDSSLLINTEN